MYCGNCGVRVEEDALFCEQCGVRIEERVEERLKEPVEASFRPLDPSGVKDSAPKEKKKSFVPLVLILLGSIIGIFAVTAVTLYALKLPIGFLADTPFSSVSTTAVSDETTDTTGSSAEKAGEGKGSSGEDVSGKGAEKTDEDTKLDTAKTDGSKDLEDLTDTDEKVFTALEERYNALPDYESKIKQCATDFNNNYLKESSSLRKGFADVTKPLKQQLEQDLLALKELKLRSDSKYKATYDDMCTLYDCLVRRISVIHEAWQISLSYSKPADHVTKITEPLARDNVDGVNKYKTLYEDLYPKSKPTK